MARFHANEAKNYGGQGGGGFLSLADDGDVVRVRFLYDTIDDVEGISVHRVEVGQRDNGSPIYRYVNCLREYNDPVDKCPFCSDGKPVYAKLFIPVYDVDTDEVKTWERGKKFFAKMSGLCSRYPHIVAREFDIERHGKHGSMDTTYEVYPVDDGYDESLTTQDFPAKSKVIGGLVLDKTADDMQFYLENGQFPPEDDEEPDRDNARSVRRGSNNAVRSGSRSNRRVPVRRNNDESEVF